jgi:hypothetical protein
MKSNPFSISLIGDPSVLSEQEDVLNEIAKLAGQEKVTEPYYSLAPPTVSLIINLGEYALGCVAAGLLGKIGVDAWDALKNKLIEIINGRKNGHFNIDFELMVTRENKGDLSVGIKIYHPSVEDIDIVFKNRFQNIDEIFLKIDHSLIPGIVNVGYSWSENRMYLEIAPQTTTKT